MVHVVILPQKRSLGRVPWVVVDFASEMKWSVDKIKGKNYLITELKPIAMHPRVFPLHKEGI